MIPTTIQELALMIYMMEINEWGVDSNEKLCTKMANESFAAANVFFSVAQKQQEQKGPLYRPTLEDGATGVAPVAPVEPKRITKNRRFLES